ncbi:MAG: ornithine cyclodeaminase family protein [Actinomycetota bacterium]
MGGVLFLSRADVVELLEMDALFRALERALIDLSGGRAVVPPRVAALAPTGLLGAMPGYLPGTALEAKLVTVYPGNHDRGLPSHQGLIAMFDEGSGEPLAVMDAEHITGVRTGAAAAVAARALARPGARVLAILGAGVQGRSHLDAFTRALSFEEIRVASRNPAQAEALAARAPGGRAVDSFEEAVRGADVICCCTDAPEPVIAAEWVAEGAHVSSVGSGRELDERTVAQGSVFVEWRGAVENLPPAGAHELQGLDPASVTEVGEVLAGAHPGRRSAEEVTVYKSTGHAVEDAAAARLVYDRAREAGVGTIVSLV